MVRDRMHVVTLGGGRGHAQVLAALAWLDCRITAIVSVGDDGGCSGQLRRELGMAPPGDLRRCLSALAGRRNRAARMEQRLDGGRCVGNLMIADRVAALGDLQCAVDELGWWLGARGRVCPASLGPSTLEAVLDGNRSVRGETAIATLSESVRELRVHAASGPNPAAIGAIACADWILIGPGSFYTSTLAALLTPGMPKALIATPAPKLLVVNLAPEDDKTARFAAGDYLAELERHFAAASAGRRLGAHVLPPRPELCGPDGRHEPVALAGSLAGELGVAARRRGMETPPPARRSA
jgi:uncharacterized cofD-like protein